MLHRLGNLRGVLAQAPKARTRASCLWRIRCLSGTSDQDETGIAFPVVDEDESPDSKLEKDLYKRRIRRYTRRKRPLPLHYSEDAERVVHDEKKLLMKEDKFRFGCTGCGMCCRDYAASVTLDPYDLFRMRQKVDFGIHDSRCRHGLGMFSKDALGGLEHVLSDDSRIPATSRKGVAPVMFLNTVTHADGATWCGFADVLENQEVTKTGSNDPVALCSLGPAHMPLTCALYPLGEISTNYASSSQNGMERESRSNQYLPSLSKFACQEASIQLGKGRGQFSLDHKCCEGVYSTDKPKLSKSGTTEKRLDEHSLWNNVDAYLSEKDYLQRKIYADWFRCLTTTVGCAGIDRRLMTLSRYTGRHTIQSWSEIVERYFNLLRNIWYGPMNENEWEYIFSRIDQDSFEVVVELEKSLRVVESGAVSSDQSMDCISGRLKQLEKQYCVG
eukprot:gb/GECG01013397.1/.p1 GENE.gb/GECG01013397.1/~~gb/GECG01013397.1/.p1  ORF type:complete len:444 (+),score=49.44 gb/GECG01013397.1/:1-1332(+)